MTTLELDQFDSRLERIALLTEEYWLLRAATIAARRLAEEIGRELAAVRNALKADGGLEPRHNHLLPRA